MTRIALVGRPLPLQAPTAFVRVRPRGGRTCGEPVATARRKSCLLVRRASG